MNTCHTMTAYTKHSKPWYWMEGDNDQRTVAAFILNQKSHWLEHKTPHSQDRISLSSG